MVLAVVLKLFIHLLGILLVIFELIVKIIYIFVPKKCLYQDLQQEVVLITGGGDGLGRCLAVKFSLLGCKVVIWDINENGNRETERIIRNNGGECHSYLCDITDREKVYDVARRVKEEVGPVTILINNAAIVCGKKLLDIPDNMAEKTFQVNVISHFWMCKAFLPDMISVKRGHIVCVASLAGFWVVEKLSDYCSSKAAAINLSESISLELIRDGHSYIHTTLVLPFWLSTNMFADVKHFIPSVKCETAAERIVNGVMQKETVIFIPDILSAYPLINCVIPRKIILFLYKFIGIPSAMANFSGKRKRS